MKNILSGMIAEERGADKHVIQYLTVSFVDVRKSIRPMNEVDDIHQGDLIPETFKDGHRMIRPFTRFAKLEVVQISSNHDE